MTSTRRLPFSIVALGLVLASGALAQQLTLPNKPDSLKFAVIGDTGTGDQHHYAVAEKLVAFRNQFKYEFLLMMGDNTYGGESAQDFQRRFELPYKPLLDAGVKFYAALGNHDDAESAQLQAVQHGRSSVTTRSGRSLASDFSRSTATTWATSN